MTSASNAFEFMVYKTHEEYQSGGIFENSLWLSDSFGAFDIITDMWFLRPLPQILMQALPSQV